MLSVTPQAAEALKNFLSSEGKESQALRIVAHAGCCSGATYGLFLDKEPTPDDLVLRQDGITIYVDKMSESLLSEAKLDFEDGPQGAVFFIDNPKDKQAHGNGSCGCGNGSCGCNH